jgi:hypothetical protein
MGGGNRAAGRLPPPTDGPLHVGYARRWNTSANVARLPLFANIGGLEESRVYVTTAQACDEPNSATPVSAAAISSQDSFVNSVGNEFLNGNAAVYGLVQSLGGNMPGLVPGVPPPPPAPAPPAAPTVYAAPGVLAAPPGPIVPSVVGGIPLGSAGVDLGPFVSSMVQGCNPQVAGPQLAAAGAAAPNGLWILGGLGLLAVLAFLSSEGAYRE